MFGTKHPRAALLKTSPMFKGCTDRELESIATITDDLELPAGHVLAREGATGFECFVILDGEASVTIGGVEVARLGEGDLVGEMSIIDGGRRSATVVARTPMYVVVLTRAAFGTLLSDYPAVARRVLATLSGRLRALLPAS